MSAISAVDSAISGGSERDVLADTNNLSDVSEQKPTREGRILVTAGREIWS
jgi:hypothetical protein